MNFPESKLNEKIDGCSFFTWREALWLSRWKTYHSPTQEEYDAILQTAQKLDKVRRFVKKPFTVTSWIRPTSANTPAKPEYIGKNYNSNTKGAAAMSSHIFGLGVDFVVSGMSVDQLQAIIEPELANFELAMENNGSKVKRLWIHLQNRQVGGKWRKFNPK